MGVVSRARLQRGSISWNGISKWGLFNCWVFFLCVCVYLFMFFFSISPHRIAAAKCRMKRKIFIQELERKAVQESERNIELQAHVNILRDEVMQLKNQLLMVKKCSCGGVVE